MALPKWVALIHQHWLINLDGAQDGHVVVWHDEEIFPEKCQDTKPLVGAQSCHLSDSWADVLFSGRWRSRLSLCRKAYRQSYVSPAQDVGLRFQATEGISWVVQESIDIQRWCSRVLALQLTYPGTKISTVDELFEFARCVDSERTVRWNMESKINPLNPNSTRGVRDFVTLQHQAFLKSGYKLSQITVGPISFSGGPWAAQTGF